MRLRLFIFFATLQWLWLAPLSAQTDQCHYTHWAWNVHTQQADNYRIVTKHRAELTAQEQHPLYPCSICREDQQEIILEGIEPFLICSFFADEVKSALQDARAQGFELHQIVGYRVGLTRGPVDAQGYRTQYSNHAYGIAIDVNPLSNGLYDQCLEFGPNCRLRRGGVWNPAANDAAITKNSALYRNLRAMGWQWGGELQGQQKDFMHFSPSGD
ncbi:MAG: M15 family metallopeptidase [bacterium]